jgi:hypothetical protein
MSCSLNQEKTKLKQEKRIVLIKCFRKIQNTIVNILPVLQFYCHFGFQNPTLYIKPLIAESLFIGQSIQDALPNTIQSLIDICH